MQPNLATFGMRFRAAIADTVMIMLLTGLPILTAALLFPNRFALPFYTVTTSGELGREEVREEGVSITTVDYIDRTFDLRGSLISECLVRETTREFGSISTSVRRPTAPCKRNLATLDSLIWIAVIIYGTYFEMGPRSATLGKKLERIRVVRTDNSRLSWRIALWRNFAKLLFGIGFFVALFTKRRQTIHDLLAKTIVIRSDSEGNAPSEA